MASNAHCDGTQVIQFLPKIGTWKLLSSHSVLDKLLDLSLCLGDGLLDILLCVLEDGTRGLLRRLPHGDTADLNDTDDGEEEVDGGEAILSVCVCRSGQGAYSMFLGRMTKHQRVQMRPVQVRAKFWVKESFSAGRAKSDTPARTRDHCVC